MLPSLHARRAYLRPAGLLGPSTSFVMAGLASVAMTGEG
jgi:hypothetical protein